MAQFVECIDEGKQPPLTGEDGRAVLEVIFAAYESARTGQRVSLPFETDSRRPIDLWLDERSYGPKRAGGRRVRLSRQFRRGCTAPQRRPRSGSQRRERHPDP